MEFRPYAKICVAKKPLAALILSLTFHDWLRLTFSQCILKKIHILDFIPNKVNSGASILGDNNHLKEEASGNTFFIQNDMRSIVSLIDLLKNNLVNENEDQSKIFVESTKNQMEVRDDQENKKTQGCWHIPRSKRKNKQPLKNYNTFLVS
jgi:hypothetical protein